MYQITSAVKSMFDNNFVQQIRIHMDTVGGDSYDITENDILAGTFNIDRYSVTGNRIEIGTATAGECTFKMKNYDAQWSGVSFEGAQLYVTIRIADWASNPSSSDINIIPCGYFTVDKPVKNGKILEIVALDRMAKFDRLVDTTAMSGTYNPRTLIDFCCTQCGVLLANGSELGNLPNATYALTMPNNVGEMTYRNLLQSACMLLGACAFVDWNGQLRVMWYTMPSSPNTYNTTNRYNHTVQENDIEITGVYFAYEDDDRVLHEYLTGTKDYCFDISENPLVTLATVESAVQALGTALDGFTYRPITMTVKPAPYLYPMDMFNFVTTDGATVQGIVSKITFGVNAHTHIESNGETNEDNGYATYGNFTAIQSKIIEKARTQVSQLVNERTQLLLNLNEMIANSLGLYVTADPVTGGGYQYYFHDASTRAGSSIIYTFTSNGIAWTDDWNDGSPVWQYGITRDGNAIINMLNAYKISADIITAGTMRAVNLIFGTDPNTTELRTNDAQTGALFDGTGVMEFNTVGRFNATNKSSTSGYDGSVIRMMNDTTNSGRNYINLMNYRPDKSTTGYYADLANSVYITANNTDTTGNTMRFQNYARSSASYTANQFALEAISTRNQLFFYNYIIGSNSRANEMTLKCSASDSSYTFLNRDVVANVNANQILMSSNPNASSMTVKNRVTITNYGEGKKTNEIDMTYAANSNTSTAIRNYGSNGSTVLSELSISNFVDYQEALMSCGSSSIRISSGGTLYGGDGIHFRGDLYTYYNNRWQQVVNYRNVIVGSSTLTFINGLLVTVQ